MSKVGLVGAGNVGKAFLRFHNDKDIIVADPFISPYGSEICSIRNNYEVVTHLKRDHADTAVVCIPGSGDSLRIIEALLSQNINVIDVSFHEHNVEMIGDIAETFGVWYIPDCGLAPGIMNMMTRRTQMNILDPNTTKIYVGGLPLYKTNDWHYISTWNTMDHLSEYVRRARYIQDGKEFSTDPLNYFDIEYIDTAFGELECFLSDGLRSLLRNPGVSNLYEYTARWPGFIKKMQLIKSSGLLHKDSIEHFAKAIERSGAWKADKDDIDLSYLYVVSSNIAGLRSEMILSHTRDGLDSSMAKCTAVGAAAALHMAIENDLNPGLHTIENLVRNDKMYKDYIEKLAEGDLIVHCK